MNQTQIWALRFLILLVTLTGPVFPAAAGTAYVGVHGGLDATSFAKTLTIAAAQGTVYDKQDNLHGDGQFAGLVAGYAIDVNRFSFALELRAGLNSLRYEGWYVDRLRNETSRGDFTMNRFVGLVLAPGLLLGERANVAVNVGLMSHDFTYSEAKVLAGSAPSQRDTRRLYGGLLGASVTVQLLPSVDLRLAYAYVRSLTYIDRAFPTPPGETRVIELTPRSSQTSLAILYRFD